MKDFEEWWKEMEEVYEKFRRRSEEVTQKGLESTIPEYTTGGYLLFRLLEEVRRPLAEISEEISRTTPSTVYSPEMLHLTLSDFGIKLRGDFPLSSSSLSRISEIVDKEIMGCRPPGIYLDKVLYNSDTIIVEGYPYGEDFYNLAKKIVEGCEQRGIELRPPWGAHVTVSRISESRKPEDTNDFLELMKSLGPIDKDITLRNLELGSFFWDGSKPSWKSYRTFQLE